MFVAEYYRKDDGTYPVEEFIFSLDNKMRAKVLSTIVLLEEYGTRLRLPYSEHLENGIFELRKALPGFCISSIKIEESFLRMDL